MTALAQGSAGLALVMCFALLGVRQAAAATLLLFVQSAAVAVAALALHQPLMAAAILLVDVVGASWFLRHQLTAGHTADPTRGANLDVHVPAAMPEQPRVAAAATPEPADDAGAGGPADGARSGGTLTTSRLFRRPAGYGVKRGILLGAVLAALCQSCGALALPLAVILLSILLAATRAHRLMRLIALVSLQNGLTLAVCLMTLAPPSVAALPALACFTLPLPFALGLALQDRLRHSARPPAWIARWLGWVQLVVSLALFAASLLIPLNPLGAVFAPTIGAWGIAVAWAERRRRGQTWSNRAAGLTKLGFMLLAVASPQPVVAWLCVVIAITAALFPTLRRRWDSMLLASCAIGLALFGLLTIPAGLASVSYTALFVGYGFVAAVVPDLSVVIVVLILRLATQSHLPPIAGSILISVAVAALLTSAVLLTRRPVHNRATLLPLAQSAVAAITLGIDLPQARFAALVLLILLILTRAAARIANAARHDATAAVAIAGLGGIPPFGVFPGLVLVLLASGSHAPWLLLPLALGLAATVAAALPSGLRRLPTAFPQSDRLAFQGPLLGVSSGPPQEASTGTLQGASPGASPGTSPGASGRASGSPLHAPVQVAAWTRATAVSAGWLPLALALLFGFFAPDPLVRWLHTAIAGLP